MTDIYFVRHAESFGNAASRIYGWFDGRVTPYGYAQIECLKARFSKIHIDAVYSSDLLRACETSKAIYEPKGLPLYLEPAFREISLGPWEDITWDEASLRFEKEFEAWQNDPLLFCLEGAETYADVFKRTKKALDRIVSENDGKAVAIVSHGAALRLLMYGLTNGGNLTDVGTAEWGDNTCVSYFKYEDGEYECIFQNSNEHLCDLPGFGAGMAWTTKSKAPKNAHYRLCDIDRDLERLHKYHYDAWLEVFGEELSDFSGLDRTVKKSVRKDARNVTFWSVDGEEIGVIEINPSAKAYPGAGHVSFLYLKPEFRRTGYGIRLLGHAISFLKSQGYKYLSIRCAQKNISAYNFYTKYGFYEVFRENDDGIIQRVMLLDL